MQKINLFPDINYRDSSWNSSKKNFCHADENVSLMTTYTTSLYIFNCIKYVQIKAYDLNICC